MIFDHRTSRKLHLILRVIFQFESNQSLRKKPVDFATMETTNKRDCFRFHLQSDAPIADAYPEITVMSTEPFQRRDIVKSFRSLYADYGLRHSTLGLSITNF
jgi:hypothetical protein